MTAGKYRFMAIALAVAVMVGTSLADSPATQNPTTQESAITQPSKLINLEEMSRFDMDQQDGTVADIPRRFQDLGGKRVTFLCEMWGPVERDHGTLGSFEAVYSKAKCCFSGPPLAQNFCDCDVLPNVKVHYFDKPVRVTGIFHIKIQKSGKAIKSIYQVDVQSVEADEEPIEVNLKDMSLFDFNPQSGVEADIPKTIRDLDGKRVTFVCEMWAPVGTPSDGLSFFQAVYSKTKWSFRGAPHPQDFWDCFPNPGVKVIYMVCPVKITGIFHIKIQKGGNGNLASIYRVNVESLKQYDGPFPPPARDTTRPDF